MTPPRLTRTLARTLARTTRAFALLLLALLSIAARPSAAVPPSARACVLRAEVRGVVNAGTASYMKGALDAAEAQRCGAVLVALDTPGGMLDATREIVATFLNARTPVIVYVSPAGARAGSAGVFVTLAAHVAAMAPGSNMGAAHPVMMPGGSEKPDEALVHKIESDAAALARAIAEQRDRNVRWAESAVRRSASATASEALALHAIDLIASSERDLLARLDGRSVTLTGGEKVVLSTRDAQIHEHRMTVQQRALTLLGEPNLAYALVTLGLLALMLELYTPGFGAAGVVGGLCLLLAVIGLNVLPVHVGALFLIALAIAFFVAEMYVASHGLLALGGVACLIAGGALLLDRSDPEFLADASVRLSFAVIVPLALLVFGAALLLGVRAARARGRPSPTGVEGLRDETGSTLDRVDARGGAVRVHGERWNAVSDEPLPEHTPVRVLDVDGLTLRVTRAEPPERGAT